ncbi:MAG: DNA end-binding protein Ku [Glaciecola sp.]|jgi:DNA end-binding protein Ku
MPRAIWSGAISFGLVNIPIKLVTAVSKKNVGFRELRREDGARIRHKKVAGEDEVPITSAEMVKGYEISPDRYVIIDPEELKGLNPKATRTIEIEDFVDLADIDPIYFDSPYFLVPGDTAAKAYKLLHAAMIQSGKAGIARFVLRTKQYLAVMRPIGDAIGVSTMVYSDEVVPTSALDGLPGEDVVVTDKELAMAAQLIESLAAKWEPEKYRDTYREQVLDMIERKAEGQEVITAPDDEKESGDVVDLMAALEASLAAAKAQGEKSSDAKSA